jgi:hypothetical protein
MKFYCKSIGLFSLFLLFTPLVNASTIAPRIRKSISAIAKQPLAVAKTYGSIGAKALVTIWSGKIACQHICKIADYLKRNGIKFEIRPYKDPFESALITTGLAMLAYECGNSLIDDINNLK